MYLPRKSRHISNGGRAFIPLGRIRRIKWEGAVMRSIAKRRGIVNPSLQHSTCHCGSIECLSIPYIHHHW